MHIECERLVNGGRLDWSADENDRRVENGLRVLVGYGRGCVLHGHALPATIIEELKHILGNHAGESEVVLAIQTSAGPRTLRLGEGYRVNETPSLRAELGRILGPAALQVG